MRIPVEKLRGDHEDLRARLHGTDRVLNECGQRLRYIGGEGLLMRGRRGVDLDADDIRGQDVLGTVARQPTKDLELVLAGFVQH